MGSSMLPEEVCLAMRPGPRQFYGLATMHFSGIAGGEGGYEVAYGHLGDTFGFNSIVVYFPKLDLAFAIAVNFETDSQDAPKDVLCLAYNRVKDAFLGVAPRSCRYVPVCYYGGSC